MYFVPFIFSLDKGMDWENGLFEDYNFWAKYYFYAEACIKHKWPILSHERYCETLTKLDSNGYKEYLADSVDIYEIKKMPTQKALEKIRKYFIEQKVEDSLISNYPSQKDCWIDLLKNESDLFAGILGDILDRIIKDYKEKPAGLLVYELAPKALYTVADKRGIPVIFQGGGVIRPPFGRLNHLSLVNGYSAGLVQERYEHFLTQADKLPILSRKGLLRLFIDYSYILDIHDVDKTPEYEVGIFNYPHEIAFKYIFDEYVTDEEMLNRAKKQYQEILTRSKPGYESSQTAKADFSPTAFHFCLRCERIVGFATKGMFEAMLANRIAHEYGSLFFHSLCNEGLEDTSIGVAPVEYLNFVLFSLCSPFRWHREPTYLKMLVNGATEAELYLKSFKEYTKGISAEDIQFYYMNDNRGYRLGTTLYFTKTKKAHEYGAYYCTEGLYLNQGDCTWAKDKQTSFEFDLEESLDVSLSVSVLLHKVVVSTLFTHPRQRIVCEVNGFYCDSFLVNDKTKRLDFDIPKKAISSKIALTFKYSFVHYSKNEMPITVAFKKMKIYKKGTQSPL